MIRAQPFLKWAGGKGQLLDQYESVFPAGPVRAYFEPFLGSGAVFFYLRGRGFASEYHLSDSNAELINAFLAVRDRLDELIDRLKGHESAHSREHYYAVRAWDRQPPDDYSDVDRAARLIYLNKTCYNGLWRVNSQGHFNVPMGRYKKPDICNVGRLSAAAAALQGVTLAVRPFEAVLDHAGPGDFVYFDPPYDPLSETASFTNYAAESFGPDEQRRLRDVFTSLDLSGCRVMLSNSDTEWVRELYWLYRVETVRARRAINSKSGRRGPVTEIVAVNY